MSIIDDDETLGLFIEEARDNLNVLEKGLLSIEAAGAEADSDLVNEIFRAVHSIKGGAGFFGMEKLKDLSHGMENLLNLMRNHELVATPSLISILLTSADTLNEMILDPKGSNDFDIAEHLVALKGALAGAPSKNQVEAPVTLAAPGCPHSFALTRSELEGVFEMREFLYLVFFQPSDFKERTFPELLLGMAQTGILVGDKEVGKKESVEEPFAVLFATVLDPEMIGHLLDIPSARIWNVVPRGKNFCVEPLMEKAETVVPQAAGMPSAPSERMPTVSASLPRKETGEAMAIVKQPLAESTLRVNVKALDRLMNLAGELVLTRNQMAQNVSAWNKQSIENTAQRLNLVTSDLQEAIMSTRMQPIGNVFNKFTRVVRDLCHELGKEIDLIIEGVDVNLDKTIIEAIGDPLTHLIRNAVDHGVEMPKERRQAGKDSTGTIKLSAFHEAGQAIIEIADDGNGIDARKVKEKARSLGILDAYQLEGMSEKELVKLIFHPGFSLAQKVTDISGRGVGMDVVHTNLTKIGGVIDIDTQLGKGTTFRIKLPLTLAIIPSLLIGVEDERYAIPQVNLVELVRVPAANVKKRIERIGKAMVIRLRGSLLPIVRLRDVFGIPQGTFQHPDTGKFHKDLRNGIADRRSEKSEDEGLYPRSPEDRRFHSQSAINIVVVTAGDLHYGIIVDNLLDSEEIVVKPLGRHLSECRGYAGATILGDGKVALILDVVGISTLMRLSSVAEESHEKSEKKKGMQDAQSLVIVKNAKSEQFAVPLGLISRIERIDKRNIELTGGQRGVKYRGTNLALFSIEDVVRATPCEDLDHLYVIVFPVAGREVGILVSQIIDVVDIDLAIDETTFRQSGVLGSVIVLGETTLLLDLYDIVAKLKPEWAPSSTVTTKSHKSKILLVEDSQFFLNQIKSFLEDAGYLVITAEDGVLALESLEARQSEIAMVVTDIEMPNLDGLELTRRIRADQRFKELPVIAVTSVAGESAEKKGLAAGIDDYLIKLDREKILERVGFYLRQPKER